jgi:quinol monooxygenase YgiN
MWAQLITMSLTPGHEQDLESMFGQLQASEQADSGLLRTITMRDQADPNRIHTLVIFESEEKARARESDPRRGEAMAAVRALMTEMFDGAPEFTNLEVLHDA